MSDPREIARRIDLLLNDEAVQTALSALKQQNSRLFLGAHDDAGRAMAQAQALVLEGFETTLRGVMDAGERERLEQERRDRGPTPREP